MFRRGIRAQLEAAPGWPPMSVSQDLGKVLNAFELQFPHLRYVDNVCFRELLWRANEETQKHPVHRPAESRSPAGVGPVL